MGRATKIKIAAKYQNKGSRSRKQFIYLMFPAFYCRPKWIYDREGADKTNPPIRGNV